MALLLRQRWNGSPLAYPAGAVPGIDWSHPATQNLKSMVFPFTPGWPVGSSTDPCLNFAGSAGFERCANTANGTGSVGTGVDGILGPVAKNTTSFIGSAFSAPVPSAPSVGTGYTFAAIARPVDISGTIMFISVGDAINDVVPYLAIVSGNFAVRIVSTFTFDSLIPAANNVPYFYAASMVYKGSNIWDHVHVVRRLDTGQMFTGSTTGSNAGASPVFNGGQFVYAGGGGFGNPVTIGPAMTSGTTLTLPQLQQWAAAPWSFWYPAPQGFPFSRATQSSALLVSTVQSWPSLRRRVVVVGT